MQAALAHTLAARPPLVAELLTLPCAPTLKARPPAQQAEVLPRYSLCAIALQYLNLFRGIIPPLG